MHYFTKDTNLFDTSKFVKHLNKLVSLGIKHLNNWLGTSKIPLNVEKTKLVILKSSKEVLPDKIKIKACGKRLYPSNPIKNLGVWIDRFLH